MSRSPTVRLLFGLLITLLAVTGFSAYALHQVDGLRRLQANMIDLNRQDSSRLLKMQNDLNTIDSKLQELVRTRDRALMERYWQELQPIKADVTQALRDEAQLPQNPRRTIERNEVAARFSRFWNDLDSVQDTARTGNARKVQSITETLLIPAQTELAAQVSIMLERNNATEGALDQRVSEIYNGAADDIYVLLVGTILAISVTSLYLIYSNRKLFEQLESFSHQRRVLAARLITVQEEVLRSVSRELHDEFGQILTAIGAMLTRAEKRSVPIDSPLRTELSEVRQITHNTLEKIRSLSQMLHPSIIDDFGLAKAVEWYTGVFERQTGIETEFSVDGPSARIVGQPAIHCYRIVQEALTNAAKHSGSRRAAVNMSFSDDRLTVTVKDFGSGLSAVKGSGNGLGLIAMRERAEILKGKLEVSSHPVTGVTVAVNMPIRSEEPADEKGANRSEERVLVDKL